MRTALAILMSLYVTASPAQQQPCAPFAQWKAALEKAKQKLIGLGPIGETHVVMFWATPGGEHWTILSVDTTGKACAMAAGADWDQGRIPAIGERSA